MTFAEIIVFACLIMTALFGMAVFASIGICLMY